MTKVYCNRVFIKVETTVCTVQSYGIVNKFNQGDKKGEIIAIMSIDVPGFISQGG